MFASREWLAIYLLNTPGFGGDTEAIHHYGQLIALTPEHYKADSARKRLKKLENPRPSWKPGR